MKCSCLFTSLCFHLATATCYFPNGIPLTPSNHPGNSVTDYVPCNPDPSSFSMCCATNRTNPKPNVCLPNGLCQTNGEISPYYRLSCTDSSWTSPLCLRDVCTNPNTGGNDTSDSGMAMCDEDGSWCCGRALSSQSCCGMKDEDRIFLASTVGLGGSNVLGTPAMESSTSTSSALSAATTAEVSSPTSSISSSAAGISSSISGTSISDTGILPSTLAPSSTTSVTLSSYATYASGSPQVSTVVSTVSPLWYHQMSTTYSSTSPTSTSSAYPKSNPEINMHIGIGVALGVVLICIASLLIYIWRKKRALQSLPKTEPKPQTPTSTWDDSRFEKPELDTREEIHMIGYNENQYRVGRAELSEVRAERFELEGGGRRSTAGIGNGSESIETEERGGASGLEISNMI